MRVTLPFPPSPIFCSVNADKRCCFTVCGGSTPANDRPIEVVGREERGGEGRREEEREERGGEGRRGEEREERGGEGRGKRGVRKGKGEERREERGRGRGGKGRGKGEREGRREEENHIHIQRTCQYSWSQTQTSSGNETSHHYVPFC